MNQSKSSCSVALCTYNGEKYLPELLDSIIAQTTPVTEIIIVDDCSSDSTRSILEKYSEIHPQIRIYPQKSNLGPIAAFQTAIQLTSHPYIFLADQDDIWKSNKIELMLTSASNCSHDKPALVYSDLEVIDKNGNLLFPSFWKMAALKPHLANFKSLMFGNVITGCASLINAKMKEFLTSIPQGVLMHDHWIGLIAYGIGEVVVLEEKLVRYRTHGDSVTEKKQAGLLWKVKTQVNHLLNHNRDFLEKEIEQMIQFNQNFRSFLTDENQRQVENFIGLKDKSLIKRKLGSYLRYK